jgi:hypothetical protein
VEVDADHDPSGTSQGGLAVYVGAPVETVDGVAPHTPWQHVSEDDSQQCVGQESFGKPISQPVAPATAASVATFAIHRFMG